MTDDFDSFLDDDEQDTSEDEQEDTDAAESKSEGESESDESSEKRIRDLQSKADKAEARANKLAKELERQAKRDAAGDENTKSDVPEEVRQWLDAAKERTVENTFKADERFEKYGIDPAFIEAETPSQLKERAKALSELVTKMEGQIRNEVLVEHGFAPEPATSERSEPVNYKTMSSEEFAKVEQRALNSGVLRRS